MMRSGFAEATTRGRATAPLLLAPLLPALLLAAAVPALGTAALAESLGGGESRCARVAPSSDYSRGEVRCGSVRLRVGQSADWMHVICEQNDTFACEELREARPLVEEYMTDGRIATNRTIEHLQVQNCILPSEQLRCPLWLVGSNDTIRLTLKEVQGTLLPLHVEGMQALETVHIEYRPDGKSTTLPYEALSKLPSLRALYVSMGALVLEQDADHSPVLEQLRILKLTDTGLRSLPRGGFRKTPNVEFLSLSNNDIEYIDEDAFLGLARLANMSLASSIRSLPPRVFARCPRLTHLWLFTDRLEVLPAPLLRGLPRLTEVMITNKAVPLQLENGVFANLPALYFLSVTYASVPTLSEELFRNSTELRDLELNNNALRELPADIFRGLRLERLVLRDNKLRRLPADVFYGQDRLQLLYLHRNALETLDESLFRPLSQLRELYLGWNRLHQLSTAIFHIPTLERLILLHNNLSLSCSNGSHGASHSAQSLHTLNLSHNRLSAMCEEWRVSRSLRNLELSYNEFTSLSSEDMAFLNNAKVYVQHNRIRHFHLDYNRSSESSPTFYLGHNPLVCDCELHAALAARAAGRVRLDLTDATCADPPPLRDASLAALAPNPPTCVETACPSGCECVTHSLQSQVEVECQTLPLAFSPKLKMLSKRLRLTRPSDLFGLTSDVTYANLSGLNLTEAPRVNTSIEIDLSRNLLRDFPIDLLEHNCTLRLADNPFDCGCDKRDRFIFLNSHSSLVKDYSNVVCDTGTLVSRLEIDLSCAAQVGVGNATIIGSTVAVLGVLVAVVTAAAYRYKTEIRILLRMLGLWRGRDEVDDKPYDAFVSFAYQDHRYVEETLVPALESGRRPLRLLLHHRDWVIGDFIPTQIASSVDDSRRTIIVLSRHFLESAWAQMEFQTAHGSDKLIILMLEDPDELRALCAMDADLRAYLALNTYVRADDPLVFERLKDAVLRRRKAFARTRERTDVQTEETRM